MPVSTQVVALGYLGIGVLCLLVLHGPLRNLDKPGSVPFLFAIFAVSLWPFAVAFNLFFEDLIISMAFFNLRMFAAIGVSIGWFLVAYEYAFHRLPPRRHLAVFGAYLLIVQTFIWSNPIHGLVLGPGTTVEQGLLEPTFGPLFWVQTIGNYLFIVAGTAIFLGERMRSHGRQRVQATLPRVGGGPTGDRQYRHDHRGQPGLVRSHAGRIVGQPPDSGLCALLDGPVQCGPDRPGGRA